ncbi:MAG: phosphatidate cytidylyltransferase [Clostridia bacterium]|nr:phosphatidate cytidylyltransferase [Clostridia bacterium]
MKTRLITSAVGAALFFVVLLTPPIVFQLAVIIVTGIATYEIYSVTGIAKKLPLALSGCFGIALCALLGCMHLNDRVVTYDMCLLCLSVYIGFMFCLMVFDHKNVKLADAAIAFFVSIFVAVLFSYLIPMREAENGILVIIALFVGTWCGDSGAYFIGIRFGKHKMAPVLSPKKSWEGFFGGILGSIVGEVIYSIILNFVLKVPCNELALVLVGIGCAVLGPVSDIATSAIKREFGVKDYGTLFPGHGGILDRFDSVLLTTPFVYFISQIFNLVG